MTTVRGHWGLCCSNLISALTEGSLRAHLCGLDFSFTLLLGVGYRLSSDGFRSHRASICKGVSHLSCDIHTLRAAFSTGLPKEMQDFQKAEGTLCSPQHSDTAQQSRTASWGRGVTHAEGRQLLTGVVALQSYWNYPLWLTAVVQGQHTSTAQ